MSKPVHEQTVEDQWLDFALRVLPDAVSPVQYQEMRRAFFAGYWAMLSNAGSFGTDDAPPSDVCVSIILRWQRECGDFFGGVKSGIN